MKKIILLAIASVGILSFSGCAEREPRTTTTTTTEETSIHRPMGEATTTTETRSVRPTY